MLHIALLLLLLTGVKLVQKDSAALHMCPVPAKGMPVGTAAAAATAALCAVLCMAVEEP